MEADINVLIDLSVRISKAHNNFKKSPKERVTETYVETRLETLDSLWERFSKGHDDLFRKYTTADLENSVYGTEGVYDVTDENVLHYKCDLKEALKKLKPNSNVLNTSQSLISTPTHKPPSVQLPKISIPVFSGCYTEWMSFRDLFTSLIHNNNDIDDVQKLHYLKAHLKGETEQLLRHIPITNDSYEQCWTLLKSRYNNKQYLVNCILQRFFGQKSISTESSSAIKQLLDVTTETLNALKGLGIDTGTWDVMIIYIVSQRLDAESRKQWESKVSELVSRSDKLPTFTQFQEFLETKYHSLEFLDSKSTSSAFVQKQRNFIHGNAHSYQQNKQTPIHMLHVTQTTCVFCKRDHHIRSCKDFINTDLDNKRNFVQAHGLCFNCLGNNHSVKYCRNTTSCQICNRRHHSLLHAKSEPQTTDPNHSLDNQVTHVVGPVKSSQEECPSTSNNITSHFVKGVSHQVLLATALVKAESQNGEDYQLLRALIDQGSTASFITKSAVQLLGLKTTPTKGYISGLGGEQRLVARSMVEIIISSRLNPGCVLHVSAYVLDKLTAYLPATKVSITSWPELECMTLADPEYHTPNKIDILLGAEVYGRIINQGVIKYPLGSIVAQNTTLGWILSGQVEQNTSSDNKVITMHTQVEPDVEELLKSFWEIEAEPFNKKKILTVEEQRCEDIFHATTTRDEDGRYVVRLPFRDSEPACADGQSRDIALKRFLYLERKFQKNEQLKQEYKKVFDEYLELNHMKEIHDNQAKGLYIPYHAVIREDRQTTKFRVVFDASCKGTNGISLNDDLMVGPRLQPELRHIIMRWRKHPVCFIADIVKMYRQIKVNEEDSEYQRILWRETPEEDIKEYKMLRVTFGTSSAPYLAVKSLIQVAEDEGKDFPLAAERVKREFYMDDLMSGCESDEEAIEIYKQMNEMLKRGGFELQKWSSNSEAMLKQIQQGNLENQNDKKIEVKLDAINKILGLTWDRSKDEFTYAIQLPPLSSPVTKRKVIADIARLYDPLGWIAPSIVQAKILIQKIWLAGISWDEELPSPLLEEWLKYRNELSQLTKFRLPRWTNHRFSAKLVEVHGFSDASNAAFAAVAYLRVITAEGIVQTSLVSAKTRVAPIKQVSTPRLELCGAVLLSNLLVEVAEVLEVKKSKIHAWTDSEVVLAWLSSHPSRWKTFVGNRCSEILTVTDRGQWSHVKSEQNPADCASRGIPASILSTFELWLSGPAWLKQEVIKYTNAKVLNTELEERKLQTCHTTAVDNHDDDEVWSKFSSLTKLLRVVAYCRRISRKDKPKHEYLLKKEIDDALIIMIKKCQMQTFHDEWRDVKQGNSLNKKSVLNSLNPQLDEFDILRVGGRLHYAEVDQNRKHPIILPKQSLLTTLILRNAHKMTLHGGPQLMMNFIRDKYYIIGLKSLVKFYCRKCVTCIRYAAANKSQLMGQLPSPRVTMSRAFLRSGVDYAGPINIRMSKGRGNRSYKGYICLFVCMATRAIHLEAVSDLTSQGFLAAYKRFISRRGHCSDLYSDNGTNFVGAARELRDMFDEEKSRILPEIADWLATNGTQWHFIPTQAPNFGGLWEAGVRSCKYHMRRIIGNSTLTFEEISTVLSQIEACLNSRPMSYIQDQDDAMPLTPGHFLIGEPLLTVPDYNYEHSSISSLRRWHLCQRMLQDFWRRWSQEYLTHFMQRYKWTQVVPEPNIGDVVLVKELDLPPSRWLLGQVVEKHPGVDKLTRVVTLRYKNSLIKRPVSKLCVLPLAE